MKSLIVGITVLAAAAAASPAQGTVFYGLLGSDRIVTFNDATPGTIAGNSAIVGLGAGEVLTGIDVRPATREIYSVATSGNVYRLVPGGGAYNAILVGNISNPVIGSNFGIDFNPTVDRLRFVSDADQNLRINPNTGLTAAVDGAINPAPIDLIGSAYTNNFAGATATSLFGIDALTASLMRTTAPNAGTYFSVGSLGLGPIGSDARIGFDIVGRRNAFMAYNDNFYSVNLDTGTATLIGQIGAQNVRGLTANIPEPGVWAMLISGFGLIGLALRRRRGRALLPA